ncbi:AMP phosphorylase [Candidatus Woesearchaeota archaeon]|nr:AMP phosphorylase [Candidatus Woesearchaeota archaeon]
MKLSVKDMDISSGDALIGILNEKDAKLMDFHPGDRIKIVRGNRSETVMLNISVGKQSVPKGSIGLFEEVLSSLQLHHKDSVEILPVRKPFSLELIKKKLDRLPLACSEIRQIVSDIVHNRLSSIELTYFVAACYMNELSKKETLCLTREMAMHGDKLKLSAYPVMDKHCIGGVAGNRTTMIIVPILAAAGLTIPKTSSRSITSPAGTADTMEVLADVSLSLRQVKQVVEKTNGCIIWGGALRLAPADDKIIRVERPLSIDAESQLLASVIAKKASVGATHVLIDIPFGSGSKVLSRKKALHLKREFEDITGRLGIKTHVLLSDGSQPIGNGIGPALEARDVLWVLRNDARGPADLRKKSLAMAGMMLEIGGKAKRGLGLKLAEEIVNSGQAYRKFVDIIKAQGERVTKPEQIKPARYSLDIKSPRSGTITHIQNSSISKIARVAGAPADKAAGLFLYHHVGDRIQKGEPIFTVYSINKERLAFVKFAVRKLDGVVIK